MKTLYKQTKDVMPVCLIFTSVNIKCVQVIFYVLMIAFITNNLLFLFIIMMSQSV